MRSKLDWLLQIRLKEIFFLALLVLCGGGIGFLCGQVSHQYENLFFPFSRALKSAAWVIGSLLLIAVVIGIITALVRPLKHLIFGHALGAIAFLLTWRSGWISFAGALIYLAGMAWYSQILTSELEKRLVFSLRPVFYEQRKIFLTMALLLSISFAWGYQSIAQDSLKLPQGFKDAAEEMMLSGLKSQVKNQPGLDPVEQAIYLGQARRSLDETWNQLEESIQPYVLLIPIGLILPLYLLLVSLLDSLSWIPYLLLWLIFRLFTALGIAQIIVETKEQKSLRL